MSLKGLPACPRRCWLEADVSFQQTMSTQARSSQCDSGSIHLAQTLILGRNKAPVVRVR